MKLLKLAVLCAGMLLAAAAVYFVTDRQGVTNLVQIRMLVNRGNVTVRDLENALGVPIESTISPDRSQRILRYRAPRLFGSSLTIRVRTDTARVEEISLGNRVVKRFAQENHRR